MDFFQNLFSKPTYPSNLKPEVDHLIEELIRIGKADDFLSERPGQGFNSQCRNIRAREIGTRLNTLGGVELMLSASQRVRKKCGKNLASHLDYAWTGIGKWTH